MNITEEARLKKNLAIKEHGALTREKHSKWNLCIIEAKIVEDSLSKEQKESLSMLFVNAKWLWNDWLRQADDESFDKWHYLPKANQKVKVLDRDGQLVERTCDYIGSQIAQDCINTIRSNIRILHTLKEKGIQNPGKIKFKSEVNCINLRQFNITYSFPTQKKIKIQGIKKPFRIRGLEQKYKGVNIWEELHKGNVDFANAKLLKTPRGYYIKITAFINPEIMKERKKENKAIGIDFGCSVSFTTSEGEKIDVKVEESDRLKRLQRKYDRQIYIKEKGKFLLKEQTCKDGKVRKLKVPKNKRSNSSDRTNLLIRREYQKLNNIKNNTAKQLVSNFCKNDTIVIQDEQLRNWHKGGHGKAIQHSVLGRVKSNLLLKPNTVTLSKSLPTTKLCTNCGQYHDEIKVWHRQFICDCGVDMNRDIHAAQNMLWFYENNIGVERTKFKRVEIEALVKDALNDIEPTSLDETRNCYPLGER